MIVNEKNKTTFLLLLPVALISIFVLQTFSMPNPAENTHENGDVQIKGSLEVGSKEIGDSTPKRSLLESLEISDGSSAGNVTGWENPSTHGYKSETVHAEDVPEPTSFRSPRSIERDIRIERLQNQLQYIEGVLEGRYEGNPDLRWFVNVMKAHVGSDPDEEIIEALLEGLGSEHDVMRYNTVYFLLRLVEKNQVKNSIFVKNILPAVQNYHEEYPHDEAVAGLVNDIEWWGHLKSIDKEQQSFEYLEYLADSLERSELYTDFERTAWALADTGSEEAKEILELHFDDTYSDHDAKERRDPETRNSVLEVAIKKIDLIQELDETDSAADQAAMLMMAFDNNQGATADASDSPLLYWIIDRLEENNSSEAAESLLKIRNDRKYNMYLRDVAQEKLIDNGLLNDLDREVLYWNSLLD